MQSRGLRERQRARESERGKHGCRSCIYAYTHPRHQIMTRASKQGLQSQCHAVPERKLPSRSSHGGAQWRGAAGYSLNATYPTPRRSKVLLLLTRLEMGQRLECKSDSIPPESHGTENRGRGEEQGTSWPGKELLFDDIHARRHHPSSARNDCWLVGWRAGVLACQGCDHDNKNKRCATDRTRSSQQSMAHDASASMPACHVALPRACMRPTELTRLAISLFAPRAQPSGIHGP